MDKVHYQWPIAIMACFFMLFSNGMVISGLSVYDVSLINEFDWDRGALKFRDLLTFLVAGLCAPFIGIIIDKYGVRVCLLMGWVLLLVCYFFYGYLQSLAELYFIHIVFGLVLTLCGLNVCVILVSQWFNKRRGAAIGITLVGSSLGGIVMPQYGTLMNDILGWRNALHSGMVFPVLMLIITWWFLRDKTHASKLEKNAPISKQSAGGNSVIVDGIAFIPALKSTNFWALAIMAMTTFYTVLGVQSHLFLYMRDNTFTAQVATNAVSAFFMFALIGKFAFGFFSDYFDHKKVIVGNLLLMLLGAICLAQMDMRYLWFAVCAFGLGWGGAYTMIQITVINCFGLKSAGKILGAITVLDALGGGLGIWLTGVLYEKMGSYEFAFQLFTGLILIAIVCIFIVRIPSKNKESAIMKSASIH